MKFEEALVELRKGKKIACHSFPDEIFELTDNGLIFHEIPISFFILGEWGILEEPGKTFDQVFKEFEQGKKIRRKIWPKDVGISIKMIITNDDYLMAYMKDLTEKDWEVISD